MQIFTPHHTITRAGLALVALMMADLSAGDTDERAATRMREALCTNC